LGKEGRGIMNQSAEYNGIVNEKLETAINIGCTMVSRSKKVRKKLDSTTDDNSSLKKSLKELDKMSMELIDKLFEINAQIDLPVKEDSMASIQHSKFRLLLNRILQFSRKRIENMKLAYQDMYTL
jgi:predicted RNase H-like nuclease (RuvC/YqgF family)